MITTRKTVFLGCSCEHHIANVIDNLLKIPEHNGELVKLPTIDINDVARYDDNTNIQSSVPPSIEAIISLHCSKNLVVTQDFSIKDKHRGFLNHGPANFSFIGSDREPVRVESWNSRLT